MSHLRAPAARPDRREGGRHGRPGTRSLPHPGRPRTPSTTPDTRIRLRLLRAAGLPVVAVALGATAVVLVTLRTTGAHPSAGLWALLVGFAALTVGAVGLAVLAANRAAASVRDRCDDLRLATGRAQNDLRSLVEQLRRGEKPPARRPATQPTAQSDEFGMLAFELTRAHEAAATAVVQASRLSSSVGNEQKVEVFVNLARRLQSLVHREIQLLDELENEVEDPELLKGLFHIDHLATRIRRHAENLAVLGGAISRRQWSNPVTMTEVLRSSIAEVEHYPRVKLVPPIDGTLRGHAVADVIHLLAELVENATVFSAPGTPVLLRATHVTAGLAVEVEDRGLGMPPIEQHRMNALLTDPDQVNVGHLLQDGRIGLYVVSALARRHGIAVRLQSNIYGGVQAVLVLPQELLGDEPAEDADDRQPALAEAGDTADGYERAALGYDQAAASAETLRPPVPAPTQAPVAVPAPVPGSQAPAPPADGPAAEPPGRPPAVPVPYPAGPGGGAMSLPYPAVAAGTDHEPAPLPVPPSAGPVPPPSGPRSAPPGRSTDGHGYENRYEGRYENGLADTAERPRLPRRRAQEHLVPELRDAPAPRGHAQDEQALHDPELMAAFRRGIGLAESMPGVREAPAAPPGTAPYDLPAHGTPPYGVAAPHPGPHPPQPHDAHKE
ncbi:sensor histidine kinase [Streptomyces lichenis]|uniref:histidine kinase n=1 Tax=Streptomyces lichenis TaxID=2306967 RepID=A0ABT0I9T9_9ACTN|nr:ATP-binding protein [Streptomyces lichenis]MCK8678101.1 ATP-binding protein [Streptomyces lichenis]